MIGRLEDRPSGYTFGKMCTAFVLGKYGCEGSFAVRVEEVGVNGGPQLAGG